MKSTLAWTFAALCACAPCTSLGQVASQQADTFGPVRLVGEWKFQNRETGVKYGGDVAIDIRRHEGGGVMRGLVSYDGRQTNDKCSTRGAFSDSPVEAEIIKTELGYRIVSRMNCVYGESPRQISWNLTCGTDGICSEPRNQPWGTGVIAVGEKK